MNIAAGTLYILVSNIETVEIKKMKVLIGFMFIILNSTH